MAKKKSAIGDLIKGDMSRRAIVEAPKIEEKAEPAHAESPDKKPAAKKPLETKPQPPKESVPRPPAAQAPVIQPSAASEPGVKARQQPEFTNESAGLMAVITGKARSVGLTSREDLMVFYNFLESQATRYLRGFDAGKRFHG